MWSQVIAQMLVCLLLAGLLGAIIGWLLRSLRAEAAEAAERERREKAERRREPAAAPQEEGEAARRAAEQAETIAALERRGQEQAARFADARSALDAARAHEERLLGELRDARAALDVSRGREAQLAGDLQVAQSALESARANEAQLASGLQGARSALESARAREAQLATDLQGARSALESARANEAQLVTDLQGARSALESARAREAQLVTDLQGARSALESAGGSAAQLAEAQRGLRECRDRGQALEAARAQQEAEAAAQGARAAALAARLAQAEQEAAERGQALGEIPTLRARIAELEAALAARPAERPAPAIAAAAPAPAPAAAPAPAPAEAQAPAPAEAQAESDLLRIEGIGPAYCAALRRAGVDTQAALLARGATPRGRRELARATEISDKLILRWVNHVDLMRVQGMDEQRAELLEVAGVDSVPELAQRRPESLHKRLVEVNRERPLAPRTPAIHEVKAWVARAKQLPRAVFHENPQADPTPQGGRAMSRIIDIEGIGEVYGEKLAAAGVSSVEELLEAGATRKGREELAERTGIAGALVLKWVNHADLFRIKGVGGEYAELLEAAGVDSVPELAQRNADNLHEKLAAVNEAKQLVRQLPSREQVAGWVEQAGALPRKISH